MPRSKPFTLSPSARAKGITRAMVADHWFAEHGTTCRNCGLTFDRRPHDNGQQIRGKVSNFITVGHVISRAHGGPKARWNLVPLCKVCNDKQGDAFWPHLWGDQPPAEFHEWQERTGWRS